VPAPGELVFESPRRGKPPRHLADLDVAARREAVVGLGLPAFRADQLSRQWFARLEDRPERWTDVPADLREPLAAALTPTLLTPVRTLTADAGTTVKTLWRLHDGSLVESVLMRYPGRVTMCVSSQAGCGMNCPFCATGQAGLTRNLSTAEIVEQVLAGSRALARDEVGRPWPRLERRAHGHGRAVGQRRRGAGHSLPTVRLQSWACRRHHGSTVGLVPRMRQLADEGRR
jgi:23S rRNA (adenine2503-C2)-methyltransferase